MARGFLFGEFAYLRDPWNILDVTVITLSYLTIVIQDLGNLSVMRTFRVLRALKTVAIIPGMKTIVGAVIDSVKNLKDVVVLTLFSLSVFSLLGLQIYMGLLTQKCILNGPSNMNDTTWFEWNNNSSNWLMDMESETKSYKLCGNATDTFGWSLICSFRLMTQDYWEGLYMQVLKTAGSWHIIFFIVSIFLGSIYLMNLILAIVAMSYNELQRRAEEEEEANIEDEAAFLESCRLMEMQERGSEYSHGRKLVRTVQAEE
jgi:voltage-gated sodium channel type II alpha